MSKIKLDQIDQSLRGAPGGFLLLDESGRIASNRLPTNVGTHLSDTDVHVTPTQKLAWNNNITNLVNHIADTVAHISTTERTRWNNAQRTKLTQDNGLAQVVTDRPVASGFFVFKGSSKAWFPGVDDVHVIHYQLVVYGPTSKRYTLQIFQYLTGSRYFAFYDDDAQSWSAWTRIADSYDVDNLQNGINQLWNATFQRQVYTIPSLGGGATLSGTSNTAYSEGNRVYIEMICTLPSGMTAGTALFTLPAGLRPSKLTYMSVQGNNNQMIQIAISTGGVVSVNTAISSATAVTVYNSFSLNPVR